MAASESGFLAVGDVNGEAEQGVAVLRSTDGLDWTEVQPGLPDTVGSIYGATSWSGGWLAWGYDCSKGSACDDIWTSVDGLNWISVGMPEGTIWGVTEFQGQIYAVGDVYEKPAVWASADGMSWHRVLMPGIGGYVWGVTASDDALFLRGSHDERALDRVDQVWMSRNGRDFDLIGSESEFGTPHLRGLAVSGSTLVAGGVQNWDIWPPRPAILVWKDSEGG